MLRVPNTSAKSFCFSPCCSIKNRRTSTGFARGNGYRLDSKSSISTVRSRQALFRRESAWHRAGQVRRAPAEYSSFVFSVRITFGDKLRQQPAVFDVHRSRAHLFRPPCQIPRSRILQICVEAHHSIVGRFDAEILFISTLNFHSQNGTKLRRVLAHPHTPLLEIN